MTTGPQRLSVETADRVALVTLRRPEKRNALSLELRAELAASLAMLADDGEVACAVLTGAGSAFCSGMDTAQFGGDRANRERIVETSLAAFGAVARFPKPLLAAVNGPAIAGGFVLALHADLRLASQTARFGFAELPRGIPPSYAAARAALPEPLARELCLTGRLLDADEALECGLVAEVLAPDELLPRTLELARSVARLPPWTALEVKRRFLVGADHARAPLFADEERAFRAAVLGPDDSPPAPEARPRS
ncbi:MAG: enoyl-CoA hydratase/isomerase family protein [Solirubrobacteraceae bacterium]